MGVFDFIRALGAGLQDIGTDRQQNVRRGPWDWAGLAYMRKSWLGMDWLWEDEKVSELLVVARSYGMVMHLWDGKVMARTLAFFIARGSSVRTLGSRRSF